MLVERDTLAFLAGDWSMVKEDFYEDGFVGIAGPSNPDHWRIRYDSLASYREDWLRSSKEYFEEELAEADKAEFLFEATVLRDIEIRGDHALAHKKFDGCASTTRNKQIVLRWQTVYHLRRMEGRWFIAGFTGYLPNPMPDASAVRDAGTISRPDGASQHVTAGPYSPVLCVESGRLVVISGQGPINDAGKIIGATIEEQTHFTMQNCVRQLAAGGVSLRDVFRVTVYLGDMKEWEAFNEVYRTYFTQPYPARTAVQCVLWGGIRVEIEMWAIAR
jgi:reactive intermediate/imine deaminase